MSHALSHPLLPTMPADPATASAKKAPQLGLKSGKKICCSCPDSKKARDLCLMEKGADLCADMIEAHKVCLRAEGFTIR